MVLEPRGRLNNRTYPSCWGIGRLKPGYATGDRSVQGILTYQGRAELEGLGLNWRDLSIIDVSTDVHYELPVHIEMGIESVPLKNPKRDQEFPWAGLFII